MSFIPKVILSLRVSYSKVGVTVRFVFQQDHVDIGVKDGLMEKGEQAAANALRKAPGPLCTPLGE